MRDPHSILGIPQNASAEDAKKAYRRLARKYHPDVSKEPNAEEKFKEVQAAYEAIKNPQKYQEQQYQQDPFGFGVGGFDDFIHNHFGMGARNRQQRRVIHLQLTLEESFFGVRKNINGMEVDIPAGVRDGTQLLVDNTLVIAISVLRHHLFQRNNDDLMVMVDLTLPQAVMGCEVHIRHLSGNTLHAKIPAGIQSGQVVRISKQGLVNPQISHHRGDLFLQVRVLTPNPNTLTEDQKQNIMSIGYQKIKTI